jgi:hypothetical protein
LFIALLPCQYHLFEGKLVTNVLKAYDGAPPAFRRLSTGKGQFVTSSMETGMTGM